MSRAAKKVLELALREAIALRHDYIGTEHLLLGLVREGDRVVRDSLSAFDIAPAALRSRVADAVRKAG
jgi:ATP-dependent Clp protease ATP-binding subunit ClpC